jgi:hypothetical protein
MIGPPDARQRFRGTFLKQPLHRAPLPAHLGQGELVRTFPSDHDEIDAGREHVRPLAEALAAEAFHAVSPDRRADFLRHDHPKPCGRLRRRPGSRRHQQREMRGPHAQATALGGHELAVLAQPSVRAEAPGQSRPGYFL